MRPFFPPYFLFAPFGIVPNGLNTSIRLRITYIFIRRYLPKVPIGFGLVWYCTIPGTARYLTRSCARVLLLLLLLLLSVPVSFLCFFYRDCGIRTGSIYTYLPGLPTSDISFADPQIFYLVISHGIFLQGILFISLKAGRPSNCVCVISKKGEEKGKGKNKY